jgi:glutaredoxin
MTTSHPYIMLYIKQNCVFCQRAINHVKHIQLEYNIDIVLRDCALPDNVNKCQSMLYACTNRYRDSFTKPQIFFVHNKQVKYIGGSDDLIRLKSDFWKEHVDRYTQ